MEQNGRIEKPVSYTHLDVYKRQVLGRHGFLEGKTATCFPGFERDFRGAAEYTMQGVVTDGNITTARGLGFAIDLGLELVRILAGEAAVEDVKKKIQYN